MSYKISVPKSKKYILCRVTQAVTADLSKQFSVDVDRLGAELNIKNFLFDVRGCPNIERPLKTYEYTYKDMDELGLDRTARVAILVSPDDTSHDFIETINRNAGYNVRVFKERKAALDWFENPQSR
jgi:hypothetical protein